MLIVEGSDLVGKTELCKKLIRSLNESNFPMIPQHFGLLDPKWDYFYDYLGYMNRRTVMDRFIMSEVVYGNVVRNGSKISPETYRMLDGYLRQQGSVTVVVIATDDWLRRQLDEKYASRNEKFTRKRILEVNQGFFDLVCVKSIKWANDFSCDYDFVHLIDGLRGHPSSDKNFVKKIVNLYLQRQMLLDSLYERNKSWNVI